MSRPAGTVDFVLAFRPHSDLLARKSTVSAGRNIRLCSSISASFRFTRQNDYWIGQADLLDGRFTRPASKPAVEQTGQNTYNEKWVETAELKLDYRGGRQLSGVAIWVVKKGSSGCVRSMVRSWA